MELNEFYRRLIDALQEQKFTFDEELLDEWSLKEDYSFFDGYKRRLGTLLAPLNEWLIFYQIDKDEFERDIRHLNGIADRFLVSWSFRAGSFCIIGCISADNMTDEECLRLFKRFDEEMIHLRKYAGRNMGDARMGAFGNLFFIFSDQTRAAHFTEMILEQCRTFHFWKKVYCSAACIGIEKRTLDIGRGVGNIKRGMILEIPRLNRALWQ